MRQISMGDVADTVARLCVVAAHELPLDVCNAVGAAIAVETSEIGRDILTQILRNAEIARDERVPICQDTGFAVVFVELGEDARIVGGSLRQAINDGVTRGYREGYLRKSIVRHPIDRINTDDNTPAIIKTEFAPGDRLSITVMLKGGGSENMSRMVMLNPSDGIDAIKRFVIESVKIAGEKPCPPLIVGVGMGGIMETAAELATRSLLRPLGDQSSNLQDAELECELLSLVNATGIGPGGFGGKITALAVKVKSHPCHIASLPVAVKLQCHAARHASAVL